MIDLCNKDDQHYSTSKDLQIRHMDATSLAIQDDTTLSRDKIDDDVVVIDHDEPEQNDDREGYRGIVEYSIVKCSILYGR